MGQYNSSYIEKCKTNVGVRLRDRVSYIQRLREGVGVNNKRYSCIIYEELLGNIHVAPEY